MAFEKFLSIAVLLTATSCFSGVPKIVRTWGAEPAPTVKNATGTESRGSEVSGGILQHGVFDDLQDRAEAQITAERVRAQAYEVMHDYCNGAYRIAEEWDGAGTPEIQRTYASTMLKPGYHYIDFRCGSGGATETQSH